MKRTTVMAVLLTVISAVAFANIEDKELGENSRFQIVKSADSKYDLYYVSETVGDVSVQIFDTNGKLLTNDRLRKVSSFKRTYNFTQLAPGNYKVLIRNAEGKATHSIFHHPDTNTLKFMISKIPDAKSLKLLVGSFDSAKPVKVKIFDENNKLIFKEEINQTEGFSKVYNFKNIDSKHVFITVENNRESYSTVRSL